MHSGDCIIHNAVEFCHIKQHDIYDLVNHIVDEIPSINWLQTSRIYDCCLPIQKAT